jgi:hypothetical protein
MGAEIGMLVVETIAKIRRAYFVHGQPIKAICRDLGVSRKVVRKVIRSEATEFRPRRAAITQNEMLPTTNSSLLRVRYWRSELKTRRREPAR